MIATRQHNVLKKIFDFIMFLLFFPLMFGVLVVSLQQDCCVTTDPLGVGN